MTSEESSSTDDAPPATFDQLALSPDIRRSVDDLGYVNPTPVQLAVFEPAKAGTDLVVQARTGTGKTAAFGLPLVDGLVRTNVARVQAMVLCPTRELALQVTREIDSLCQHSEMAVVAVYGGAPMPKQVKQIKDGAQILVGTPGRVLDHLRRGTLDPADIKVLVLDECDEMLSMGFLPQINDIMSQLPETRQTLLFSATVQRDVVRIAETRLKDPEFITLSGDHVGALEIQHFVYISRGDKLSEVAQIVEVENPESAIVFCNTRESTKRVAAALQREGFDADWLNAELSQSERERVMYRTRNSQLRFLVATDVAARGIDISHLTHVICFDFPESAEQYVHRTGRTGRAGRLGTAISLVAPSEIGNLYMMRLTYKISPIEKSLPSARELETRAETDLVQMFTDAYRNKPQHPNDLMLARRLLSHDLAIETVAGMLRDHLGARPDATEEATAARRSKPPRPAPETKPEQDAEASKPEQPRRQRDRPPRTRTAASAPEKSAPKRERNDSKTAENEARPSRPTPDREEKTEEKALRRGGDAGSGDPNVAEVFVNVGRKDGATIEDFRDVLESDGALVADETDYVRVRHRHSFVGVRKDALGRAVDALNGATIAGKQAQAEPARRV